MLKEFYDLSATEKEEHQKLYGSYNDVPPNWKELTEQEVAQSPFFTYSPRMVEFRQIFTKGEPALSVRLFHMPDGTGYGLSNDFWSKRVRWFKFGICDHNLKATNSNRYGFTEYACTNPGCNYKTQVDSSD